MSGVASGSPPRQRPRPAKDPPGGVFATFVFGRKAQAKIRALFGSSFLPILTVIIKVVSSRSYRAKGRQPMTSLRASFTWRRHPGGFPTSTPLSLGVRDENSSLDRRRHSPLTTRITFQSTVNLGRDLGGQCCLICANSGRCGWARRYIKLTCSSPWSKGFGFRNSKTRSYPGGGYRRIQPSYWRRRGPHACEPASRY
jgi:hypothetical protein